MIKIKDFGKDKVVGSVSELKDALSNEYKSQHISIVYKLPSGITRQAYISVTNEGEVKETYGAKGPVDFEKIEKEIGVVACTQQ
jgi:hypothetical protein